MALSVTNHPLLSEAARTLNANVLAAHARLAEYALGLAGADLTEAETEVAKDAVALQVNFQVDELPGRAWGMLIREESLEWVREHDVAINPLALRIASRIVGPGRGAVAGKVEAVESKPLTIGGEAAAPFSFDVM